MYCKECGEKIDNDSKFCYKCGSPVNGNEAASSSQSEYKRSQTGINITLPNLTFGNNGENAFLSKKNLLIIIGAILFFLCLSALLKVFIAEAEHIFEDYYTYDNYSLFQIADEDILDSYSSIMVGIIAWLVGIIMTLHYVYTFINSKDKVDLCIRDARIASVLHAVTIIWPSMINSEIQLNNLGWVMIAVAVFNSVILPHFLGKSEKKQYVEKKRICHGCGSEVLFGNKCSECGRNIQI